MSHTVLLSQLERLHNRIQMLEANVGLGMRNQRIEYTADTLAGKIIAYAKHWADEKDASDLRYLPTREQITDLEHYIRGHSSGIRKEDLSQSLHVQLGSLSRYITHFVPGIWDAFYAVYGHEDGNAVTDKLIQDIFTMIGKWRETPTASNIMSLQMRVMRDREHVRKRHLLEKLQHALNDEIPGHQYKGIIVNAINISM